MPPIVSIVGKSSTGKTTFLEKLIRELADRGYRVATIKHSHHSISFDSPNKDSWRHAQAGAASTMVSSTTEIQIIKPVDHELSVEELAGNLGEDYDLILSEGFSRGNAPKVEIHRKEAGPLLEITSNLFAVVTDEPLDIEVMQFSLDDVKGVADLIEKEYIQPDRERVSLHINGNMVPLSELPPQVTSDMLAVLAKHWKGGREIKSLEFRYRKTLK